LPRRPPPQLAIQWERSSGPERLRLVRRFREPWRTAILRRWAGLALKQLPLSVRGRRELWALRWYGDELAHFYFDRTGRLPKGRGRFLAFVTATLEPVHPVRCRGSDGASVIRAVCNEFDPKAPWGIFRR
jgi:hypothetical protein